MYALRYWVDATKNTGLDRNTLSICVSLIETGVNPEALAVGNCIRVQYDRLADEGDADSHRRAQEGGCEGATAGEP